MIVRDTGHRRFPSIPAISMLALCLALLMPWPAVAQLSLPSGSVAVFNAADILGNDGDLISNIPNEIRGGPDGIATGSARPTLITDSNGYRALAFNRNQLVTIPGITTSYNNWTILVAARNDVNWSNNQDFAVGNRTDGPAVYTYNGGLTYYDQDTGSNFAPYTTQATIQGEVNTIAFTSGPGSSTFAVNGIPATTTYTVGNSAGTTWTGWNIGNNAPLKQGYIGNIYAVALYNRQLSDTELRQADAALRTNYPFNSAAFDNSKTRFVLAGDSLLYGTGALTADKTGWYVAREQANIPTKQIINVSTPGRTTAQSKALLAQEVFPHFNALSDTVLVCDFGSNDIRLGALTGEETYQAIVDYCKTVKATRPNVRIAWITMLPSASGDAVETQRGLLNTLLMEDTTPLTGLFYRKVGGPFDYVLDVANDPSLRTLDTIAPGDEALEDDEWSAKYYYKKDRIHLTNKGWAAWANDAQVLFERAYQQGSSVPEPSTAFLFLFIGGSAVATKTTLQCRCPINNRDPGYQVPRCLLGHQPGSTAEPARQGSLPK